MGAARRCRSRHCTVTRLPWPTAVPGPARRAAQGTTCHENTCNIMQTPAISYDASRCNVMPVGACQGRERPGKNALFIWFQG